MTREEAIKILDPKTCRDALMEFMGGSWNQTQALILINEAQKMGLDALRVHQSTPKLDRNRWKECFVCKGATWMDGDICISGTHYSTLAQFNFCPDCGRPLTEEAWAELERRIGGCNGKNDLLE